MIKDQYNQHVAKVMNELYNAFAPMYPNLEADKKELVSLNKLVVRIIYLLYLSDEKRIKLFNRKDLLKFLQESKAENLRECLLSLFKVLGTKIDLFKD